MRAAVLVLGGFGRDDAGAESRLAALRAGLPGVRVVAASDAPARTERAHGCEACATSTVALLQEVRRADGVVVAGGDLLGDDPASARDRRLARVALLAGRARGIPTVLLGVGVAGRARPHVDAALVRGSDLVVLRDVESASVLASAGVPAPLRVAADPAWAVVRELDCGGSDAGAGANGLAVVVDGRLGREHAASLAACLTAVERPPRVVPWRIDHADRSFAEVVARRCEGELLEPPAHLADVAHALAGASLVVTHRAHGAIAAAASGRRLLAVGARPEVAGVARALGQPHVPAHATAPVLQRAIVRAGTGSPPAAATVDALAARVDDSLALARTVLGVAAPPPDLGAHLTLEGGATTW